MSIEQKVISGQSAQFCSADSLLMAGTYLHSSNVDMPDHPPIDEPEHASVSGSSSPSYGQSQYSSFIHSAGIVFSALPQPWRHLMTSSSADALH